MRRDLMIYATGISFNENDVHDLKSIVQIKLESTEDETWTFDDKKIQGWYKKEAIHIWLKSKGEQGFKIKVKLSPYSELEAVESNGVKYVRAVADDTEKNNLLKLKAYTEQ